MFCASGDHRWMYATTDRENQTFQVCECKQCQAVYLWPHPSPEMLARAYSDDYYGEGDKKFSPWIEKILDGFRRSRAGKVARFAPPPAKVLDIGCGNGRFLMYLRDLGYQCHGMELPGKSLERARSLGGLELVEGKLEASHFPENSFDMVTLWHVFEHLDTPAETLRVISRILKPGGWLLLSLPNIHSWQARWFKGLWFHLDPPRHLFFLGPKDLTREVERLGFEGKGLSFLSLEQNPFGFQQSLLNTFIGERDLLFEALKGNEQVARDHSRLAVGWQKLAYMVTAPLFIGLAALEAAAGAGGTMELYFRKKES